MCSPEGLGPPSVWRRPGAGTPPNSARRAVPCAIQARPCISIAFSRALRRHLASVTVVTTRGEMHPR
jgi:hypothetical protein